MSTLFCVKKNNNMLEVAHRRGGEVIWLNDIAELLPDERRVYALDNTPQGIYTIGDIKQAIKSGVICPTNNKE